MWSFLWFLGLVAFQGHGSALTESCCRSTSTRTIATAIVLIPRPPEGSKKEIP